MAVAVASVAVVVFSDNKAYPQSGSGPLAFDFDFSWGVAIPDSYKCFDLNKYVQ